MINSIVKVLFENLLECDFSVIGKKKKKSVCNNEGLQVFPGSIGSQYWVELTVQHRTDFLFILIWDRASILSSKNSNTKVF